jgi:zinc transport system permease protein
MHEIFALPIFRRALVALVATGISFPALGTYILALELIPARFAVMHASLLGAACGLLIGVDPMLAATAAALLSGLGIARMSERNSVSAGGSLGLVMTATLGLAFILFYKAHVDSMEAFSLFWGNILTLSRTEMAITAAGAALVLGLSLVFLKEIRAVLYDRELAATLGIPARAVYYGIILLVCLGIGLAMRMTGALMVDAVTLLPALAARELGKSLRPTLLWGAVFGLISNLGGFALAFALDLPTSPAIILVGTLLVLVLRLTGKANRGRL